MPTELFATVTLLLILLDPLGNIPLLIAQLRNQPAERRQRIILRESLIAGVILIAFVFVGDGLLAALRLSESALEISGGLILLMIAIGMVFPRHQAADNSEPDLPSTLPIEPLIVPIAIPMIAGPAALATVLLTARQTSNLGMLVLAIGIAVLINTAVLMTSTRLARLFGRAGLAAMERLMGLVLTTMAVQMLITGIKGAFGLPAAAVSLLDASAWADALPQAWVQTLAGVTA